MRKIVAVDGGGSKTLCILVDESGVVIGKWLTGCTNHQICGIEQAATSLNNAVGGLLSHFGVPREEVAAMVFGLAGMDFPEDVKLMEQHLRPTIKEFQPEILNDIWIALATGGITNYGAISVCGTGHNTGVMTKDGTRYGINALRYPLGNYGGGIMLTEQAMHKAFRSFEKTGAYTTLEKHLPGQCQTRDMKELLEKVYKSRYTYHTSFEIPQLVDRLALEGDEICIQLLKNFGLEMGEMTGRLIQFSDHGDDQVPVVLAGSLHTKLTSSYLADSFAASLRSYCPGAGLKPLSYEPVLGAALLALRTLDPELVGERSEAILAKMDQTLTTPKEVVGKVE